MNLNVFDEFDGLLITRPDSYSKNNPAPEPTTRFPANTPLAMAYVPYQQWGQVNDESEALSKGTLFPELDFPFSGGASK
ncbi:MAG: spore coat associated protein CotJA [Ruminococcus sp.]|nr:spore coat associated protein CotJA [Ruminococcus sp.]